MKIIYNFPSRNRPDKFFAALDNINKLARHDDYLIVCKFDEDDVTMNNEVVEAKMRNYKKWTYNFGKSLSKVHAINRDLDSFDINTGEGWDFDILINMSDDIVFTKEGFDLDIIEGFIADDDTFDLNLCLHFPDGYANERQITMAVMGRDLYDRFGYIYHPDYKSLWCDNEMLEVVRQLGVYKYINKKIFKHEHPVNNRDIPMDDQYKHTESFHNEDFITYKRRMVLNFGL